MKIIVSSLILILVACNTTKKSSEMKEFPSGMYELIELNDKKFEPLKTYTININTEEQRIGGKFDCNSFSCEYKKDGQQIDFGYAISTKMYCEGKMNNENTFFGNINKMKKFSYDGEILTFYDAEDNWVLKLKKKNDE